MNPTNPVFFKHPLSDIQSPHIGEGSSIWQFCVVLQGAVIGAHTNICSHCFIENDVVIGNQVTVKNGVHLYDGIIIEDHVFIGPHVTFTNDKHPRSKDHSQPLLKTKVEFGASIGGGSVILPGVTIGRHAMIGAGSVITKNVPPHTIFFGHAATLQSTYS